MTLLWSDPPRRGHAFVLPQGNPCERPKCTNQSYSDFLYCSEECWDLDHEPAPVKPLARNKTMGFGDSMAWWVPEPVILDHPRTGHLQ